MTKLDYILGAAFITSLLCLTAVTVTDHDATLFATVVTALLGALIGKQVPSDK